MVKSPTPGIRHITVDRDSIQIHRLIIVNTATITSRRIEGDGRINHDQTADVGNPAPIIIRMVVSDCHGIEQCRAVLVDSQPTPFARLIATCQGQLPEGHIGITQDMDHPPLDLLIDHRGRGTASRDGETAIEIQIPLVPAIFSGIPGTDGQLVRGVGGQFYQRYGGVVVGDDDRFTQGNGIVRTRIALKSGQRVKIRGIEDIQLRRDHDTVQTTLPVLHHGVVENSGIDLPDAPFQIPVATAIDMPRRVIAGGNIGGRQLGDTGKKLLAVGIIGQ